MTGNRADHNMPDFGAIETNLRHRLAQPDDTGGGWRAGAGLIQALFWEHRFHEAADLSEELIDRLSDSQPDLLRQKRPFDDALVAAEVYAGQPASMALARLLDRVPASS